MKDLYQEILNLSKTVDQKFASISPDELLAHEITFSVPPFHPRRTDIEEYKQSVVTLTPQHLANEQGLFFVDKVVYEIPFIKQLLPKKNVFVEEPKEDTFKEFEWLNNYIDEHGMKESGADEVFAIGGGLTANVSAYVAEMLHAKLTIVPSTVIGMCDISGGKVRVNKVDNKRGLKHYYKSFYEPNRILVDPRFLDTLDERHVSTGLGEIIKHGVFQSKPLFAYIQSNEFRPNQDRLSLLRAILWAAELKEVCLRIDVEENANGSRDILRGGHEFSDRIEEDTNFEVPHGAAVSIGVHRELEIRKDPILKEVDVLYKKFSIPKTVDEFYKL